MIVYSLYLLLRHRWQNRMLLIASYVFYGAWDRRFLFLIFISTILDYFCGLRIHESKDERKRRLFLFLSVAGNLSILGVFKYYDFFAANLQGLLGLFGLSVQGRFLDIILPVGISFYTFQTMSYTIDIYRKEMAPTKRFFDFALFVAFFPQLVAGPIERARHLLPQILSPRKVTPAMFYEGCYLIFWGLFQKIFIADNLARIVNPVFASAPPYEGAKVLIALYAFAFQIFCDFAGYSNIARGLGKCMGFDLMVNFNLPYFATNPRDFWRRWHISLSTWLRDYLYVPLGGNRRGTFMTYRNLAVTMLLGGLWHGAAWTFIIWGAYQGLLLMAHRGLEPFLKRIPVPGTPFMRGVWYGVRIVFFFHIVCLGWLIFRAGSMAQAFAMCGALFGNFNIVSVVGLKYLMIHLSSLICLLLAVQVFQYRRNDLMAVYKGNVVVRALFYYVCYYSMIVYGVVGAQEFIYFQF